MSNDAEPEYCAYCGLPLKPTFGGQRGGSDVPDYCCSGCRVVAAVAEAPAAEGAARRLLLRIGLAIFFTMNVVVFTMELWSQDVYADASYQSPFAIHLRGLFQWASLLFSAPVLLLLGGPLAANVWEALRRRQITTDLLILLGVIASYLYSVVSVLRGSGAVYFEVGCVVLVFVSIGRWLEARGKHRTGAALDALARLLPEMVRRAAVASDLPSAGDATQFVPRGEIRVGDIVRVLPGERMPIDGRIVAGRASLDEQIVTGESRAVVKGVGDQVYSGVLNVDGDLWVSTTAITGSSLTATPRSRSASSSSVDASSTSTSRAFQVSPARAMTAVKYATGDIVAPSGGRPRGPPACRVQVVPITRAGVTSAAPAGARPAAICCPPCACMSWTTPSSPTS